MAEATPLEYTRKSQEQALDALKQTQEAVVDAMGSWAKAVENAAPEIPALPVPKGTPDVEELIANSFDFAGEILSAQREFTQNLISATQPAVKVREVETASA